MPFIIVPVVVFLDQLTKYFINRNISLYQSVPVLQGIFHLTLVHNRGAAFGLFKNQVPVFIIASACAVVLIIRDLRKQSRRVPYRVALSLILAGALGNLIDRVVLGYVVDFLDFRIWPVFNVADSSISIGIGLLGYVMFTDKSDKRPHGR